MEEVEVIMMDEEVLKTSGFVSFGISILQDLTYIKEPFGVIIRLIIKICEKMKNNKAKEIPQTGLEHKRENTLIELSADPETMNLASADIATEVIASIRK